MHLRPIIIKILYLWVTDELPVKFCIKGLHMQTIHIQHWITNNTNLQHTEGI